MRRVVRHARLAVRVLAHRGADGFLLGLPGIRSRGRTPRDGSSAGQPDVDARGKDGGGLRAVAGTHRPRGQPHERRIHSVGGHASVSVRFAAVQAVRGRITHRTCRQHRGRAHGSVGVRMVRHGMVFRRRGRGLRILDILHRPVPVADAAVDRRGVLASRTETSRAPRLRHGAFNRSAPAQPALFPYPCAHIRLPPQSGARMLLEICIGLPCFPRGHRRRAIRRDAGGLRRGRPLRTRGGERSRHAVPQRNPGIRGNGNGRLHPRRLLLR